MQENLCVDQAVSYIHLMDWIPDESDLISEMVYRFKSDRCVLAWKFYSGLAVKLLSKTIFIPDIDYVVVIPGSKKSSVHSKIFASMVQLEINKPVLNILEKAKSNTLDAEQKKRNRHDREESKFQLSEHFTQSLGKLNLHSKHILLVDDIRTTGSSFRQAVAVLGPVKKATLLTLFHRKAKA